MAEKIRLGIIGTGGFTRYRLRNTLAVPEFAVVAIADPSAEQRAETKAKHPAIADAQEFEDAEPMLAAGGLDAVIINTPHYQHIGQIEASLAAGLHVLCEKPLTMNADESRRAIDARDKAGKIGMVSYQRHTSGLYRTVRERIQSGDFGQLLGVQASINQNWRQGTAGKWRQVPELAGGGFLIDSGSHLLDAVLWCTGRQAARVSCISDNRGTPVDIISTINGEFIGGGLFTIFANGDDRKFYEDVTYYGEHETLQVTDNQLFSLREGEPREAFATPEGSTPDRNFADAILGRDEAQSPFEAGLAVGLLTDACHRSAARNGEFETVG